MNDFGSCDCRFLIEKRIHIIADRKSKIRFFLPIFCPSIQYCFLRFFSTLNGLSFNSMQLSPLAWRLWALCALPSSAPSRDLFGRFRPRNSEMLHVYHACPVGRNYRTGVESLTIPLGLAPLGTCFIKKSVEGRGNIQF